MRETDAAPRGEAETSPTIRDVAAYLLGEGPLLGFWFHEQPPNEPPYWWRRHLRAALAASSPPSGQAPDTMQCLNCDHPVRALGRDSAAAEGPYCECPAIPSELLIEKGKEAAGQAPDEQEREDPVAQMDREIVYEWWTRWAQGPVDREGTIRRGNELAQALRRAHQQLDQFREENRQNELRLLAEIQKDADVITRLRSQLEAARESFNVIRREMTHIHAPSVEGQQAKAEVLRQLASRAPEREEDGHAS